MKKTFMIISGGEAMDETDVSFVKAEDERAALLNFIEATQDYDLTDREDYYMVQNLLEDFPVGVVEFDPNNMREIYGFAWFYELPDVPEPEGDIDVHGFLR